MFSTVEVEDNPLNQTNTMHIGKLAELAGTTTRTVRFYEEVGLIKPCHRTSGGFRCYNDQQLRDLQMILSLKELGFELDQIRHILTKQGAHPTGGNLARDVLQDMHGRLDELDSQIESLSRMREKLVGTIDSLCDCLPCEVRLDERLCEDCERMRSESCIPFFHTIQSN
ncbi:MAG: hypothetical protein CME26_07745 [Gemmatimonadetes bacterium]|nr:hypothetical protein [Gemmatimonadota bacterium]|tara:strand:+ start:1979 stop:2485 length:507 start_codon:yes stop_codon:yes gene_type:complete